MIQAVLAALSGASMFLRSNLSLVMIAIALTAGGIFAYSYHKRGIKIDALQVEKGQLQEANANLLAQIEGLRSRIEALTEANDTNLKTIEKLKKERADAAAAIAALAASTENNKKLIAELTAKLRDLLKDPKNDGPVANVLRETIKEIQKNRK